MNPSPARKQSGITESELNRAQRIGDMTMLTASARTFADRAKSPGSIASSAAVLVAGLAAFQRDKPLDGAGKPFGLGSTLKGAALVSTLWLAFRSQARHQEDN